MTYPDTQQAEQLLRYPVGAPQRGGFGLTRGPVPKRNLGQVLLGTQVLSLDPYLRPLLAKRYVAPHPDLGSVVPWLGLARVVQSDHKILAIGTWVVGDTGWSEYAAADPQSPRRIDPTLVPVSTATGAV